MAKIESMFKSFHSGEKGFTLIELLVVVAILGAIAAVVVLNVGGFIGRGVCEGYCTEKHNIQTAIIAYGVENPTLASYPTPANDSAYSSYLTTGPKFDWSTCAVDTDTGALVGEANPDGGDDYADAPADCSC